MRCFKDICKSSHAFVSLVWHADFHLLAVNKPPRSRSTQLPFMAKCSLQPSSFNQSNLFAKLEMPLAVALSHSMQTYTNLSHFTLVWQLLIWMLALNTNCETRKTIHPCCIPKSLATYDFAVAIFLWSDGCLLSVIPQPSKCIPLSFYSCWFMCIIKIKSKASRASHHLPHLPTWYLPPWYPWTQVICCNAVLNALSKAAQWSKALAQLQRMEETNITTVPWRWRLRLGKHNRDPLLGNHRGLTRGFTKELGSHWGLTRGTLLTIVCHHWWPLYH